MWSRARNLVLVALLLGLPAAASAGTIVSTIGGLATVTVSQGTLVTIDSVITFGPTTLGGAGAAFEVSFDYSGTVVGGGGATVAPAGWLDLILIGTFSCSAGHCENIVLTGDFDGSGAVFPSGSTFALPSITVDTTGLHGSYAMGAGLTGPGDAIVNPWATRLGHEYVTSNVTVHVAPEPGTALLLCLGLCVLAASRRGPVGSEPAA